jgi:hypothetical protein
MEVAKTAVFSGKSDVFEEREATCLRKNAGEKQKPVRRGGRAFVSI